VLHRRSLHVLALLLLCGMLPLSALAKFYDTPPAQPGFTHAPMSVIDTPPGLILSGSPIYLGSPTIADIDPGFSGKEIAVGGLDGWLYVYHKDGSLAWKQNVLPGGAGSCTPPGGQGVINSAPAVGDLFGNGVPYVVIGYGTITQSNCPGGVAAYDGRNGNLRWRYSLTNSSEALHGVVSSPALLDVDGNGTLEVGFGNFERDIVMLNSDGAKRWRFHNADTVWSSPAVADADGDGLPDLIIGSDISANSRIKPATQDGGYVTALKGTDSTVIWRQYFDQVIYSSPALADLDGDGVKEVIVGSGCYFSPATKGHWLKILDIRDGHTIRTLNANGCFTSSPALADLDGNGKLDIVAAVDGSFNNPQTPGLVEAWQYDNPTPKWMRAPAAAIDGANMKEFGLFLLSPVIADIDGNGSLEVLIASNIGNVTVLRGTDGTQLSCGNCGSAPTQTLNTWFPVASTPAVGDIDGDGDLEVVIGGSHIDKQDRGLLYVWTNISGLSSPGSAPHYSAPWPMFRHDPLHTGVLLQPKLRPSATSLALMVQRGDPAQTISVALKDDAGGAIDWSATKDQPWISLNATNGTTPDTLNITIDPGNMGLGTYTGAVSLSSSVNSPKIDVTLIVVDQINRVYLPIARR
jgi:hypothetical protein